MDQSTFVSATGQVGAIRNQLDQQTGLPFLDLLSATEVESTCRVWNHQWRTRTYTPWITLSIFLSQILSSDHSCGDALERFQRYRKDCGLPPVANNTASYCEARQRLPEEVVWGQRTARGQAILGPANFRRQVLAAPSVARVPRTGRKTGDARLRQHHFSSTHGSVYA